MMAPAVLDCSKRSVEWERRIQQTLAAARSSTAEFLPDALWEALQPANLASRNLWPVTAELKYCESFVEYFSDPRLRSRLRGDLAKGAMSPVVYKCMLWFPEMAEETKAAWRTAFARNGLQLEEAEIDAGIAEWRLRGVSAVPADDNQRPVCRETVEMLSGKQFDSIVSEENIRKRLLEDLDRK